MTDTPATNTPADNAKGAPRPAREEVLVDLALQGGGSHGAFAWGVLDRLLEEPWLKIEGVSGTSAGAMNAALLADGFAAGGPEGARKALDNYWRKVSEAARYSPFQRGPVDRMLGRWSLDHSPLFVFMDMMSRLYSPYDLNPSGFNALAPILAEQIDFERLRNSPIKVFITATNVRTGRPRIFRNADITPDVLMACLPADAVSGGGDRRRAVLGRRLFRQSDDGPAGQRTRLRRHHPHSHQSGRAARHTEIRP
jgi:NTE family protein